MADVHKISNSILNATKIAAEDDEDEDEDGGFTSSEIVEEFGEKLAGEILESLGIDKDEADDYSLSGSGNSGDPWLLDGSMEFVGFKDLDDAIDHAEEYVRDMLESEPEAFNQSWLESFLEMSPTDIRVYANDEADSLVQDMSDEELVEEANLEAKYESIQEEIGELDSDDPDYDDALTALEDELESVIDEARDGAYDAVYERIKNELEDDAVGHFLESGIYEDVSDLMKSGIMSIDYDAAAEDAVTQDGVAHFLAHYDGNEYDMSDGSVWFRTN